jgi:hypothetical protein
MLALAEDQAVLEMLARRIRLVARLELGDVSGVEADLAGYTRAAERLRSPAFSWLVPLWRGMLALLRDDPDGAELHTAEVWRLAGETGSPNAQMMAWSQQWAIARRRRDQVAIAGLGRSIAEADNVTPWDCTLALLHAEAGDAERGRWHVRRMMARGLESVPRDAEWLELLWSLGEAAMLLGETDAVRAVDQALAPYADLWAVDGYGAACFGRVGDLLERLEAFDDRPAASAPDRAAFVRSGDLWHVEFRGRSATVVDSKGLRDLATLVARPRSEVHVLDLVEAAGGPARAAAGSDTGPTLDAPARQAYKKRLGELQEEIEEATDHADLGRLEQLEGERDFLLAELSSALGLGGRPRATGDPVERARKAVTMRIGTALRAIEKVHPALALHLRNSVSTGRSCVYHPDLDITWDVADDLTSPHRI